MTSPPRRAPARLALAALVVSALLHAWLHASIRPLYQVSDEISYLSALQQEIYNTDLPGSVGYQCASPPVGIPLFVDPGGKAGFRHSGVVLLRRLCEAGVPSTTAFWLLRLWSGLALPVMVACAAWLARELAPNEDAWAIGAAAVVALQPIAATFAGGITPDSFANGFAAIALLLASRLALGGASRMTTGAMVATALLAVAWKDTTLFLLPTVALAFFLGSAPHTRWRWKWAGWAAASLGLLVVLAGVFRTYAPPAMSLDLKFGSALLSHPVNLLATTVSALTSQIFVLGWGAWMPIGNFGASTLTLPGAMAWLGPASIVAVVSGACALSGWRHTDSGQRRLLTLWLTATVLCAAQPALRQVVDARPELFQGRWLFPVLTPCAVLGTWWLRGAGRRWLPLTLVAAVTIAFVTLVRIAGHYYVDFPATYDWPQLFLRSSSSLPLPEETIRLWVTRPWLLQQGMWHVATLALWMTSIVVAGLAAARLSGPQEPV